MLNIANIQVYTYILHKTVSVEVNEMKRIHSLKYLVLFFIYFYLILKLLSLFKIQLKREESTMDTIQLELIFEDGCDFTREEERKIKRTLEGLESPLGYSYCDLLKGRGVVYGEKDTKIMVKLSFPRFYFENNAHLITTYVECRKVQKYFVEQLQKNKLLKKVKAIKITRVDIPFTYLMREDKEFYDYSNVFKILESAFTKEYPRIEGKSFVDTKKKREQTVTFTDSPSLAAYNTKKIGRAHV